MNNLSVYARVKNGDLSAVNDFETLCFDDKQRYVSVAAQFGQLQLLDLIIQQYDISSFAGHAMWVAAHDQQFSAVEKLTSLVPQTNSVWSNVLRYAIKHHRTTLQNTILAFDPVVKTDCCLVVGALSENKILMNTLLERAECITASVVVQMMDNQWTELVQKWVQYMPSEEKNSLFVQCVQQQRTEIHSLFEACKNDLHYSNPNALAAAVGVHNWTLAEQLLPYCDVPSAVAMVSKNKPTQDTLDRLQRLVLLDHVGSVNTSQTAKRKI